MVTLQSVRFNKIVSDAGNFCFSKLITGNVSVPVLVGFPCGADAHPFEATEARVYLVLKGLGVDVEADDNKRMIAKAMMEELT